MSLAKGLRSWSSLTSLAPLQPAEAPSSSLWKPFTPQFLSQSLLWCGWDSLWCQPLPASVFSLLCLTHLHVGSVLAHTWFGRSVSDTVAASWDSLFGLIGDSSARLPTPRSHRILITDRRGEWTCGHAVLLGKEQSRANGALWFFMKTP